MHVEKFSHDLFIASMSIFLKHLDLSAFTALQLNASYLSVGQMVNIQGVVKSIWKFRVEFDHYFERTCCTAAHDIHIMPNNTDRIIRKHTKQR